MSAKYLIWKASVYVHCLSWISIVYIEAQALFMSTVDNIFVLHGQISHMINNNKKLHAVYRFLQSFRLYGQTKSMAEINKIMV